LNDVGLLSSSLLPNNPAMKTIAVADFNGDGKTDLLWYNAPARLRPG
jgi:hypothetical protein